MASSREGCSLSCRKEGKTDQHLIKMSELIYLLSPTVKTTAAPTVTNTRSVSVMREHLHDKRNKSLIIERNLTFETNWKECEFRQACCY